ncbi:TerD family protein [Pedococcus sp. KACC 23699]|uniref:TerD family protein n=1 Tax=Pedococcus sp. KACC 23699 TaxID=3149228 RepID=A0AAU7JXR2_9MICO
MTVNLSKGGNISLTKEAPGLTHAVIGLGWDPRVTDGATFDLDASAILCGADGKALSDENFVFYNNTKDPSGAVQHQGDNRDGQGDGDDEMIFVSLADLPPSVEKIVFVVSIDQAEARNQNFGQVANAYIRVLDANNPDNAITKYDLGEDFSTERSVKFGEMYRNNGEFKFRAVGQGYSAGLAGIIAEYGLMAG